MPAVQLLSEQTCTYFHTDMLDSCHRYGSVDVCSVSAQPQMDLVSLHDTDHHETHTVSAIINEKEQFKATGGCELQNANL